MEKPVSDLQKNSTLSRILRILPYFSSGRWPAFGIVFSVSILALSEPAIPAMLKSVLDKGFTPGGIAIWIVATSLMGLFFVRGLASFCADYLLTHLAHIAMRSFRRELFDKLLKSKLSLYSDNTASSLANTVVYEVQNGMLQLVSLVVSLVRNCLMLVAMLGYLIYLNWQLTLIVLTVFPSVAWVMKKLSRRMHQIAKSTQTATDDLAYVVEESVLANRVIRLHHAENQQRTRFELLSARLRLLALKSTSASAAMTPITQLLAAAALTLVVCIALYQSQNPTAGLPATSVGSFVAFIMAMLMLIGPIKHVSESIGPLTRGLAAVERGVLLLDFTEDETSGHYERTRANGSIAFQNVTLHYDGKERPALQNINLTVHPGEVIALVGSSGSGKTSLVNLLPRLVDMTSGQITLDDVPITDWKLFSLRSQFSYVSQDVVMFNDTLANNITLGDDSPNAVRLAQAIDAAHMTTVVNQLPEGLQTVCGHNAAQLSGGQRQRLAIARAIYKNAPILLLDEATSALDNESERAVQDALQTLMKDRTTIIVAHRLSTIQHADRIVVLSEGSIVESGTHDALLQLGGHYSKLYSAAATQSAK